MLSRSSTEPYVLLVRILRWGLRQRFCWALLPFSALRQWAGVVEGLRGWFSIFRLLLIKDCARTRTLWLFNFYYAKFKLI